MLFFNETLKSLCLLLSKSSQNKHHMHASEQTNPERELTSDCQGTGSYGVGTDRVSSEGWPSLLSIGIIITMIKSNVGNTVFISSYNLQPMKGSQGRNSWQGSGDRN